MADSRTSHLHLLEIEDWLKGRLTSEAQKRVEDHLHTCECCRVQAADQRDFESIRIGFVTPSAPPLPTLPYSPAVDGEPPQLSNYDVERKLGEGGFGEVWLARYLPLDQLRAIKVLRRERFSDAALAALRHEARLMAKLDQHHCHPNRVQVYDFIEEAGHAPLVMAYVEGAPLSARRLWHWEEAIRFCADAAAGLHVVHAAGILHRDIKPSNLLWDRKRETVLVSDFGLAARAEGPSAWGGTLGYMAPELLGGEGSLSVKSDVLALAATLFHLVIGNPPFPTTSLEASLAAARLGLPRPLPEVPQGVEDVIRAGLEPDPAGRPGLDEYRALLQRAHLAELAEEIGRNVPADCPTRLQVDLATADEREKKFHPIGSCDSRHTAVGLVVRARTGDLLRIAAQADSPGFVTVLHFGSSGQMEVLLPNAVNKDHSIKPGKTHYLTVQFTPPADTERTAIIWTPDPIPPNATEWRKRIIAGRITERDRRMVTEGEQGERSVVVVVQQVGWTAVVVTVLHQERQHGQF